MNRLPDSGRDVVVYIGNARSVQYARSFAESLEMDLYSIMPNHPGTEEGQFDHYMIVNEHLDGMDPATTRRPIFFGTNRMVMRSPAVSEVMDEFASRQETVLVAPYSSEDLTFSDPFVLIGPGPVAGELEDKRYQRIIAEEAGVPIPRGEIIETLPEVVTAIKERYGGEAFVSLVESGNGFGCERVTSPEDLYESRFEGEGPYIVADLHNVSSSPSSLGIVVNDDQVIICGVSDQILLRKKSYRGNSFPANLTEEQRVTIEEYTRAIGRTMSRMKGYRGCFGVDYLIDGEKILFAEINPRKTGWNGQLDRHWNLSRNGRPTLTEMEMMAVIDGHVDGYMDTLDLDPTVSWGVYHPFVGEGTNVTSPLEEYPTEAQIFDQRDGMTIQGVPLVGSEHISLGKLGRIVSVRRNVEHVRKDLNAGRKAIENIISSPLVSD